MSDYDNISELYYQRRTDKTRFDYNRDIEVPAMIKMIGNVKNKVILDMGCGFGDHAHKLSKQGAKEIIGFDLSKEQIKFAKKQKIKNAKFDIGSMDEKLKYKDNNFDLVISSLALHYVKHINQLFAEVNRVLKKNSLFIISTGHPIFDLLCESVGDRNISRIQVERKDGKQLIEGNYFDETPKLANLGGLGKIMTYPYTFETLIKAGLKNGFELTDYHDAKPIPSSKSIDPEKYKLNTTLPSFILFKWKKK